MPRARTLKAALIVLSASLAGIARAEPEVAERFRQLCLGRIEHHFKRHHLDLERIDQASVCETALAKGRSGLPMDLVWEWVDAQVRKVHYHFAPPGAKHARNARYRYPYTPWIPRLLTQAAGGGTHNGKKNHYGFDFLMPMGTPVLAARRGRVAQVTDGTPDGVPWQEDDGNGVKVLHEDGTYAIYHHFRAGVPVKVGQRVKPGALLGFSGHTGYSAAPHLHFSVHRMDEDGEIEALPIRFGPPGSPGIVPEPGHHWGNIPRSKVDLRVSLDGSPASTTAGVARRKLVPLRPGDAAELKVEIVGFGGERRDVTHDERTRYESMTVWTLHSPAPGRLLAEPIPGITPAYIADEVPDENRREGLLFVYHGKPWEPDFGLVQVAFDVGAPAAAP